MDTPTGIPQGSPLSPILYLFYNADLIEELSNGGQTMGWIDDVGLLVEGDSAETNCQRIESMLETAYQWADQHASVFAPEKFAITHFCKDKKQDLTAKLHTQGITVEPE